MFLTTYCIALDSGLQLVCIKCTFEASENKNFANPLNFELAKL